MRLNTLALAAALAVSPMLATSAAAATTVGTYTQENCFPFGCLASRLGIGAIYQQAYASSAFTGATAVNTLSFYGVGGGTVDSASYNIAFYLTPLAPAALTTNPATNRGTLLANFGTFTLNGATPTTLTLTGTEFTYNPSLGNLLMQVTVAGLTAAGTGTNGTFQTQGFNPVTGRLTVNGAGGGATVLPLGIVTTFDRVAAVPEPASWAMLIGGFALAGGTLRRPARRRASMAA